MKKLFMMLAMGCMATVAFAQDVNITVYDLDKTEADEAKTNTSVDSTVTVTEGLGIIAEITAENMMKAEASAPVDYVEIVNGRNEVVKKYLYQNSKNPDVNLNGLPEEPLTIRFHSIKGGIAEFKYNNE